MGKISDIRCESGSDIVCLEGNGARPSHRGIGFIESQVMYTLNTTEVHAVAYGIEPGAAQRLNTENRIHKELSPTLRANAGDNQASVAICKGTEDGMDSVGTSPSRLKGEDSRRRHMSESVCTNGNGGGQRTDGISNT